VVLNAPGIAYNNSGMIAGGAGGNGGNSLSVGGGGGDGGYGIDATSSGDTLINSSGASIAGGNAGNNGIGGAKCCTSDMPMGGGGVTGAGLTITNAGSIAGGNGGNNGGSVDSSGGAGGAGITGSRLSITNSGTITGGNGGGPSGAGAPGITGSNLSIVNSGSILGGLAGDRTTRTNPIAFTGGTNSLEIDAGSKITGNVTAFSSADTFILGGSTNAIFSLSQIGPAAQYRGFGQDQKNGTSTWTLIDSSANTTPWTITAGTLLVNGTLSASPVNVASGGTLGGTGAIAGPVAVANGGIIAPGDAPGTLTVGPLTLNPNSILNYELGTASAVGGTTNDLLNVNGALTLDGTLNVTSGLDFGTASYRLINYTGPLTDNGLAIGTIPSGVNAVVQTAIPGQVNLVVIEPGAIVQYWDGAAIAADGVIHGGNGTWDNTGTNWTDASGSVNGRWQSSFGIFTATGGTVTVAQPIAFQGLGFASDGYVVTATGSGVLEPAAGAKILVDTGLTTTISAPIAGSGSLVKGFGGTLVLTGNNTFTGGISLVGGTLQAGSDTALGTGTLALADTTTFGVAADNLSLANAITLAGTNTIDTGANTLTLSSAIADGASAGTLNKAGSGTLILTGTNAYSGGTTISAGTLQGAVSAFGTGGIVDSAVLDIVQPTDATYAGAISGTGSVTKGGAGTLTLAGVNTYEGGTTISTGTLAGAVSAFGTGGIADNAALDLVQPSDATYAAAISGTGAVTKDGAGALTLTGTNTYSGPTTINAGKLLVNGSLGATVVTVANGATLGGIGTIAGPVTVASNGAIAPGDAPGTLTTGALTLNSGSLLDYELGTANVIGGATSDLVNVNGALTLTGTLNVTPALDFGLGSYRLINYTGALTDNGLAVGTIPNGLSGVVQTAIPGEVNLIVTGPGGGVAQFWDGATTKGDGTIHGGTGTWDGTTANWTNVNGTINGTWQSSLAIFTGPAGTVTVPGPLSFQLLDFETDGYVLTGGGALTGGAPTPAGAIILVQAGATATIGVPLAGPNGIVKADAGTLALTGNNTFAGGVQLRAGTLEAGSDTALGTGTLAMSDATTLGTAANNLALGNAVTLAGANTVDTGVNTLTLSGAIADGTSAGALLKAGNGALILSGVNTYSGGTTIEAGTLAGAVSAFGSGGIVDNGELVIDQPTNATYANAISGTGSVIKSGAGMLTLTGTSSYTGPTDVAAGTLIVNGAIASSPVTLQSGSTLGGGGTVGGITALSGATVAPADAPFSTLNVDGNVTFAPDSVLAVNINPAGQNDSVAATGTATIQGGTVNVLAAPGAYLPSNSYTLVSAAGGLTGNFSALNTNTNLAFLTPVLTTDPNDVFLTFVEKLVTPPGGGPPQLPFDSVATTPNEMALADALEKLAAPVTPSTPFNPADPLIPGIPVRLVPVFDAVLSETPAGADLAFNELDGEIYASTIAAIISDSRLPREAILDRLNEPCEKPEWKPDPANPGRRPCEREDFHFWVQGFGNWGSTAGDGNTAATSRVTEGFITGMDTTFAIWDSAARAGLAAGYYHDALDDPGRTSTADIHNVFLSLYGGTDFDIVNVRGGFIYTFDSTNAFREIVFPGLSSSASAIYNGHSMQEFLELSHTCPFGGTSLEPFAGVSSIQLHQDSFDEGSGDASLQGLGNEHTLTSTILGVRAQGTVVDDVPLYARLSLGWRHAFGSVNPTATLAFEGTTAFFDITGAPINRDAAETDIGFDYAVSPVVSIGLSYLGEHGGSANDNAVRGHLDVSL
jgi:outer membrane autotransporter protein